MLNHKRQALILRGIDDGSDADPADSADPGAAGSNGAENNAEEAGFGESGGATWPSCQPASSPTPVRGPLVYTRRRIVGRAADSSEPSVRSSAPEVDRPQQLM